MVIIEKAPDAVSLAGNPVCFTLRGENAMEGTPGKASAKVYIDRELIKGDAFILVVNGTDYRFETVTQADSTENALELVLPLNASRMDVVEIAKQIARHPFFAARFNISSNMGDEGDYVAFESIENGTYVFEVRTEDSTSGAFHYEQAAQGGTAKAREDYRLHRAVYLVDDQGTETLLADNVLSVDDQGRVKNDIGEYLHPHFRFELQYPATETVYPQPGIFLAYRCVFYEEYPGMTGRMTESEVFHALPGRLSAMDYALKTSTGESPCEGLGYRFLSNYKGVKTVYPDFPEKLFFLLPEDFMEFSYHIKAEARCGNQTETVDIGPALGLKNEDRLIEYNVDVQTVKASLTTLPDLDGYTIYIEKFPRISLGEPGEGTRVSETREFRVEKNLPASLHCFFFLNAWGVPEVAVLRGSKQTELDISRDINEIEGEEAAQSPLSVRIDKNITVGSGHVSKDEWDWLCEMQRSLQVFELLESRIQACTLNNSKSSKVDEFGLWSHEFSYKYAKEGSKAFEGGFSYRYLFDSTFNETFN